MMKTREWFVSVLRDLKGTQKALREQTAKSDECGEEMKALDARIRSMVEDVKGTVINSEFDIDATADVLMAIQDIAAARDRWAAKLGDSLAEEDRIEKSLQHLLDQLFAFPMGEVAEQPKDAE